MYDKIHYQKKKKKSPGSDLSQIEFPVLEGKRN